MTEELNKAAEKYVEPIKHMNHLDFSTSILKDIEKAFKEGALWSVAYLSNCMKFMSDNNPKLT